MTGFCLIYQRLGTILELTSVKLPALPDLKNKEIVLVDDVYTTGRTLFYAAECLLPFHPKKIRTFTLAR